MVAVVVCCSWLFVVSSFVLVVVTILSYVSYLPTSFVLLFVVSASLVP